MGGWKRFGSMPSSDFLCEALKVMLCLEGVEEEEKAVWFKFLSIKQDECKLAGGTRPTESGFPSQLTTDTVSSPVRPPEAGLEEWKSTGCRFTVDGVAAVVEPIRVRLLEQGELGGEMSF